MQTFYGVRDSCVKAAGATGNCNNNPVSGRADLQQQEIIVEGVFGDFDVRVTTKNVTDLTNFLSTKQGWYMDLAFPLNSPAGERVVSQALLRAGRIIFVTLIPDESPCGSGGDSWLMELEALTGNRLDTTPFDISGDGYINLEDMVTLLDTNEDGEIDENDEALSASGKKSKVGIIKSPGVVGAGEVEYKYTSGSTGELETTLESVEGGSGRQSWRQLR
jgi:type IV pilus assembly protein PilY1